MLKISWESEIVIFHQTFLEVNMKNFLVMQLSKFLNCKASPFFPQISVERQIC